MPFPRPRISSVWFTFVAAVYFILILNMGFWEDVHQILNKEDSIKIGFAISLPVLLIAVLNIIFSFFTIKRFEKFFFSFVLLTSAIVNYATYHYGVYMDKHMIANVMETNTTEATSYLNPSFYMWIFFTGILPILILIVTNIEYRPFLKEAGRKGISISVSLALIGVIWALYFLDYSAIGRNHHGVERKIVPVFYLLNSYKYFRNTYFTTKPPFQQKGLDATRYDDAAAADTKTDLTIVILGETARAQSYELNGYPRPTNAHTKDMGVISFQNMTSCGTATALSVPCIFSMLGRDGYSEKVYRNSDNVMDVLGHAGIELLWIENDEGCKGVCKRIPTITADVAESDYCNGKMCRDDVLLADLQKHIDAMAGKNAMIVLHIMGSHGPTYYLRYNDEHRFFKPDCPRSDIQNCGREEIVNTYDNTILFTDFVMSQVINTLKANEKTFNTSLMYFSDHGESLGEGGVYLHGMPYAIAPAEQTRVPLIVWVPDKTAKRKGINLECLKDKAKTGAFSHDNISHSLLGIMNVRTSLYRPDLDIFSGCRT